MMCDLGIAVKPVLAIDAKAIEHNLHRQGIGKLKQIDVAYLYPQDEIRSQRLRVRRVRSEENVADLGTKPLRQTVIAKHCLTLGHTNMNEVNVWSGWLAVAMFWDFGSAVRSQRQPVGDHVHKSASFDVQQLKQLQDPQRQQRASGNCSRCQRGCCSTLPRIVTHCSNRLRKVQTGRHIRARPPKHHQRRRRTFPLHGTHDKSSKSIMKCDDFHENLHDGVMSFSA